MTPAQLQTLKTAIVADGALNALPMTSGGATTIAAAFNVTASPAFVVWRSSVTLPEIMTDMDWTRVDNLSVGKARSWDWMSRDGAIDPSRPNIRAGIDSVWVGTAADLAVRASIYAKCKRNATRAEQLFATGTGSDAAPATMGFEGALTADDVQQARELA